MTTNQRAQSTQMKLRLSTTDRHVCLETALELDLICALAALLHAAVRTDTNCTERGDEEDE